MASVTAAIRNASSCLSPVEGFVMGPGTRPATLSTTGLLPLVRLRQPLRAKNRRRRAAPRSRIRVVVDHIRRRRSLSHRCRGRSNALLEIAVDQGQAEPVVDRRQRVRRIPAPPMRSATPRAASWRHVPTVAANAVRALGHDEPTLDLISSISPAKPLKESRAQIAWPGRAGTACGPGAPSSRRGTPRTR